MWVERDREVIRSKVEPRTEFRVVSSTIPGSPVIIAMGQTGIQCVLKMERIKSTPDRITTQVMREGCGRHGTFPPLSAMSLCRDKPVVCGIGPGPGHRRDGQRVCQQHVKFQLLLLNAAGEYGLRVSLCTQTN